AEDGIRDLYVTGVQTCALPISERPHAERRVDQQLHCVILDQVESVRARDADLVHDIAGHAPLPKVPRRSLGGDQLEVERMESLRSEERRVGKEWRCRWAPGV